MYSMNERRQTSLSVITSITFRGVAITVQISQGTMTASPSSPSSARGGSVPVVATPAVERKVPAGSYTIDVSLRQS